MTQRLSFAQALALNASALPAGDEPVWIQLTPGAEIVGFDGRRWTADPAELVEAFNRRGVDIVVDLEHASHVKGPKGEAAPAMGWVSALDVRDGAVWGRVAWTEAGAAAVRSRGYRYLSPGFLHDAAGRVRSIVSAGLTNLPNLRLAALNQQDIDMDWTPLLAALGLPATAGPAEAVAAAQKLALNREQPDPAKFAPRADLELALNRAATAEGALAARDAADFKAKVEAAVDGAITAGKVAPASRDYHLATCREQADLDRFTALMAHTPAMVRPADPASKKQPAAGALTADELAVCRQLSLTEEQFLASRAVTAAQFGGR